MSTQKTVLITGCSTGIGASLVTAFQKRNHLVIATARNPSSLSQFSSLPNVHCLALDVTSASSIQACVEQVGKILGDGPDDEQHHHRGGLDYVVNNAGMGYDMPVLDIDVEQAKKVYETNFWGVVRVVQGFAGLVVKAKGTVVVVATSLAYLNWPYKSTYGTSKAAVTLLAETLRLELAPFGVKVLTIVTGGVQSDFLAKLTDVKLPETSLYRGVEKQFQSSAVMSGEKFMPTVEYAEQVVTDIVGGKEGKVWRGSNSVMARLAVSVFPQWVIDRIVSKDTGLDQLAAMQK
ncbi:NAD(P)-binding protein [Periconia macrospinosa]|uniref:NAD(P)-binding protein n=1 Tax=Periconia macrospinosa TaxID=97972 RepID=A0A2V1DX25_9PLEO|nr:NAD(P)-binding protein [Periconia macrospinosa]